MLVVGLAPVYVWVSNLFGDSPLTLSFAYLVLVLPYAYRTLYTGLSAIDVKTLSEAARSLGAGWPAVMWRIIVPNMSVALLNACLLSVAVVLGEYTIANLLNYVNVQVAIQLLGRANAGVSIAVAVASLLFAFLLLVSALSGLLFGIVPALQASREDLRDTLSDSGAKSTAGGRQQLFRKMSADEPRRPGNADPRHPPPEKSPHGYVKPQPARPSGVAMFRQSQACVSIKCWQ